MKLRLSKPFNLFLQQLSSLKSLKNINKKNARILFFFGTLLCLALYTLFTRKVSLSFFTGNVVCRFGSCPFKSQSREDKDIVQYMLTKDPKDKLIGKSFTVVEAGALDGIKFSNSYFFEKYLGWNAIHFEPSPTSYTKLVKNRPNAHNFNMALCKESTELSFVESDDDCCNGLKSTMSDKFRHAFHNDESKAMYFNVSCEPLKKILPIIGVDRADIFFLDVVGGELLALEGMDVTKIHYFIIEMDGNDPVKEKAIHTLLYDNGFIFVGKIGQDRNELFENLVW